MRTNREVKKRSQPPRNYCLKHVSYTTACKLGWKEAKWPLTSWIVKYSLKPEVREVLVESLVSSGKVRAEEKHSHVSQHIMSKYFRLELLIPLCSLGSLKV